MLTPAAASTLLTSILILASPFSAQALNGPQITKPTASAIQLSRSHGTSHTSNAYFVQRDKERIRHQQSRRAGLVAPKTGGAPPSERNVTQTPRPFDIKAKRDGLWGTEPMMITYHDGALLDVYGRISVGDPLQTTTVLFDTGSHDLVVPLRACVSDGPCTGPLFDASESLTFLNTDTPFSIEYEDGSRANGRVASDKVTLAGLPVPRQTFGAAYSTIGLHGPFAGILGLGFPADSRTNSIPLFGNLVRLANLQSNAFSFYMTKDGSDGSELCVGCINSERVDGEINYHQLITFTDDGLPLSWDIECAGISILGGGDGGDSPVESLWKSEELEATIDSGTSFIYVSEQTARQLYGQFPDTHRASSEWTYDSYAFPCNRVFEMGEIGFEFGDNTYVVNWGDLIAGRERDNPDECVGAIIGSNTHDAGGAVFGLSFMKNVYSVFHYEGQVIGFGKPK